jgi:hypothetical protein
VPILRPEGFCGVDAHGAPRGHHLATELATSRSAVADANVTTSKGGTSNGMPRMAPAAR